MDGVERLSLSLRQETFAQARSRGNLARGFGVLSDGYARLGENGSPKRGRDETW